VKHLYTLTDEDQRVFELGKQDARYLTGYYVRTRQQSQGWVFDDNIDPPWQLEFHQAPQLDLVVVGGMGSSKTITVGFSALTDCTLITDFKFLNVAPIAWQSKQMYDSLLSWLENTIYKDRFLWKVNIKPYPTLTIQYRYPGGAIHKGTLEFMSSDKNAQKILTWDGDWVNIDQGESVDDLSTAIINLGTRVRGKIKGRARMGRLSITANSADNPELWWLYDQGVPATPVQRSWLISTEQNKNLTPEQIESFKRRMGHDPEKIAIHMNGKRPIGGGKEFSDQLIGPCLDEGLAEILKDGVMLEEPGFHYNEMQKAGCVLWALPREQSRVYVVVGDPGQGKPPYRNAPVVLVFDVTDYPSPAVLRAFWWGDGGGKYSPFVNKFMEWMGYYRASLGAYDSTAGQKVHSEMSFPEDLPIVPMDMGGVKKSVYMVSLKLIMAKVRVRFPPIEGIVHQFAKYALPDGKIPQDIVSTFFVLAGLLWYMGFEENIEEDLPETNAFPQGRYSRAIADRYVRRVVTR